MPPGLSNEPVTIISAQANHSRKFPTGDIEAPVPVMTASRPARRTDAASAVNCSWATPVSSLVVCRSKGATAARSASRFTVVAASVAASSP